MSRLTVEERRRVFLSQEHARRTMLARLGNTPIRGQASAVPGRQLRWLVTMVSLLMALGGGVLAFQAFEFHPPASLIEALLPRL